MSATWALAFILCGFLQFGYSQSDTFGTTAAPNATFPSTDYCASSLCGLMKKHIACRNKGELAKQCPPNATLANLTGSHNFIVDTHNALRNLLAGGKIVTLAQPDRMATLEWHPELAELAALNVKQCIMKNDPCHNTLQFRNSGQNLALIDLNKLPGRTNHTDECLLKEAISGWWNQSVNATSKQMNHFPQDKQGDSIRNFALMARDNNSYVGCAALRFEKPTGNPMYLVACNYATNVVPQYPIYREKSSGCQTGADLKFPSLCKPGEPY
ncbi:hypothetical protein KR018_006762, partial [Drosophila ironensis]